MANKLYRFMLAFDGEPQDVGILQSLDDTSMEPTLCAHLYEPFETLPAPKLESPDGSAIECWFTEKGIQTFANAIDDIIYHLDSLNWQALAQSMDDDMENALYRDDYQVAYAASYLETDKTAYIEIAKLTDIVTL